MRDISFLREGKLFNYRVAAAIFCKNKILLSINPDRDFYILPGGRVQMGEDSLTALNRELNEELGLKVSGARLACVLENLFNYNNTDVGELQFIYKINLPEKYYKKLDNIYVKDKEQSEQLKWFSKEELQKINCRPKIIYNIFELPSTLLHTIIKN